MAKLRFKKPKIAVLMTEIITLTIWLFLGDKVINVLDGLVGTDANSTGNIITTGNNVSDSNFKDAFEIMGLGCSDNGGGTCVDNTENGLLGVIGLVLVVMVLMNFITYN